LLGKWKICAHIDPNHNEKNAQGQVFGGTSAACIDMFVVDTFILITSGVAKSSINHKIMSLMLLFCILLLMTQSKRLLTIDSDPPNQAMPL
jgi:hypothetical protein